ncbi:hypothetical protein L596_010685 [Steinernema carpocapsae]|uniref:Uncharacterized protein n=1 Tax=Steinernema carpocapsae TaxID=34508 RepID=A0A4U5PJ29_STECR|nr:hypothetical protein L596_010685 [Steinernema carpocapsae]
MWGSVCQPRMWIWRLCKEGSRTESSGFMRGLELIPHKLTVSPQSALEDKECKELLALWKPLLKHRITKNQPKNQKL